ncbi:MAG TPA: TolC family protein [Anaerohalosphaeraceae bacterium]|nr:TolC family protein [Anaerohalosphaeraceae bacterium]HQG05844.1 TolC family protein [Anaerohalosphaeraceae bacterium]HQI06691.1 TolC family protein [Anaerohalosphaeraceae bacterium]HQJ67431.1 TolC family protein [Anaerohalosphaeraceae bacterium]
MNNKRFFWGCFAVGLSAVLAVGCDTTPEPVPFYEMRVPRERLRQIEPLQLPAAAEPNAPVQPAQGAPEEIKLTIEQCRAWALQNNLELKAELVSPTIAAETLSAEEAKFEASFFTRIQYSKTDRPIGTDLFVQGSQSDSGTVDLGVELPLQTGGTITLDLVDNRTLTNQISYFYNPSYTTGTGVSISQPLLRNAGHRASMYSIRLSRYDLQIAEARTRLEVITVLAAADRAYWRMAAARKELEVRLQQYELAKAQLERARRMAAAGEQAEVEVLRAQAGMAAQMEQIILAETNLRSRQRELKRIINQLSLTVQSPTRIVPATEPDLIRYELAAPELVAKAVENRMELLELELQIARQVSTIDYLKNQALPVVNLEYTYNINGLGATRSDSYDMLQENRFADHRLGLTLLIPLGNEAAKSTLRAAFYQRMQLLATKENRKALIEIEVLNAMDQTEANWQRILAARQNVLLEARLADAEIRQFENGLRTSTDVLEAQARLADAQSSEIQALTEYQISLVDLAYATGTLLGAAKVDWQPVPSFKN